MSGPVPPLPLLANRKRTGDGGEQVKKESDGQPYHIPLFLSPLNPLYRTQAIWRTLKEARR